MSIQFLFKSGGAMKRILQLIILTSAFLTCQPWLIDNTFAQQYGWVDIASNIPDFPNDTLYNVSGDTIVAGLMDLSFISENEGWLVTSNGNTQGGGAVLHTTDGGLSWQVSSVLTNCLAIQMLNQNVGYAGGQSGIIWNTLDGGVTWNYHGTIGNTVTDIEFPPQPADTGYACGLNGTIYSVTSSGVSVMTSGVNGDLSSLTFPVNSMEGWVCGLGSVIRRYTGTTWVADQINITGGWNGIYFVDNQNGWIAGDNGAIKHTTDGSNWVAQTNPNPQNRSLYSVFFLNSNEGWAVGGNGAVLYTTNGGTTWNVEASGLTTAFLTGVQFTSPTNGYITGNNKTLLKYTQLTSVEDEKEILTEFKLEQNYPSPFNPTTKIKYTIPNVTLSGVEGSRVVLKVYDVLGNEVTTLVNEEKSAGTYEVEFNSSTINHISSSGIYFYQLKADDFIQTKKMVLLK